MKQAKSPPKTIDEYLRPVDADKRAALQKLRAQIRRAAPRADECISYGMPGFRLDGRMLVWIGAAKNHCALYPGGTVREFQDDLKGFKTSKGTIQFTPERPLPATLVSRIIRARIAQNAAKNRR